MVFFTTKFVLEADKQWVQSMEGKSSKKSKYRRKSSEVLERDSLTKKKRMRSQKVTCQGHFRPQVLGFHIVEL